MRWYRGADGSRCIWFDQEEIEHTMEDQLRLAGMMPTMEKLAVDVEAFAEDFLQVTLDQHCSLPPEILGLTEFPPGGRPQILINRDLTQSALDDGETDLGILGRWRATLGHEISHVVLHRILFELDLGQMRLFEDSGPAANDGRRLMRCKKSEVRFGGGHDWREVQANRGMAALLMPKDIFVRAVETRLTELGIERRGLTENSGSTRVLVEDTARRFQVPRQAATIRLAGFGFIGHAGVGELDLPHG